jgi:hypothetical protein
MGSAPFLPSSPGFDRDSVQRFLSVQLELARRFPPAALVHLGAAEFPMSDDGFAPDDVSAWLEQQRAWLSDRVSAGSAAERVASALDELKSDLGRDASEIAAQSAEQRAAAAAACAKLVEDADAAVRSLVDQARRDLQSQLEALLDGARAESASLLEQARARAGELLLEAEQERHRAEELAHRIESVQRSTLAAIDRAHRALGTDQRAADAA